MNRDNLWFYTTALSLLAIFLITAGVELDVVGKASHFLGMGTFEDELSNQYDSDTVYLWVPTNDIILNGLGISGNVSGTGTMNVYLLHNNDQLLINSLDVNNETIIFPLACEETCSLNSFQASKYLLRVELDGVEMNLDSVVYSDEELSPLNYSSENYLVVSDIAVNFNGVSNVTERNNVVTANLISENNSLIFNNVRGNVNAKILSSEFSTPLVAADSVSFDSAEIVLEKNGEVNSIVKCENYNVDSEVCVSGWDVTTLSFTDNTTHITFSVNSFSAYAGSEEEEEITLTAQDTLGTGDDGSLTVTGEFLMNQNKTSLSSSASTGDVQISVSDSAFAPDCENNCTHEIMIIELQGTNAGNYEFRDIEYKSGTTVNVSALSNDYNSGAEVIRVPHYTNVTVEAGGTITSDAWDETDGGVIVFRATDIVTIDGSIDIDGKGFYENDDVEDLDLDRDGRQGESYQGAGSISKSANLGGGGGGVGGVVDCYCTAGAGGGGYATSGGDGELGCCVLTGDCALYPCPGSTGVGGGTYGSSDLSSLHLGSSGGTSSKIAGKGGGIIFISATNITGTGSITSKGTVVSNKASGGSGGSIYLRSDDVSVANVLATGGITSDGEGGDGGDGRIRIDSNSLSSTVNPLPYTGSYGFVINNLPVGVVKKIDGTGNYSEDEKVGTVTGRYYLDSVPIVEFDIEFTRNLSFTGLRGNSSGSKAYFKTDVGCGTECDSDNKTSNRKLLIPVVSNSTAVYICPDAESLDDVNTSCPGRYYDFNPTQSGDYYLVSVNGTGGGEFNDSLLNVTQVYPLTDINVTQNEFFNVTTQVCCLNGNCSEVNASLDNGSLMSTISGTTPFYTNTSNPYNITLESDECENVTWYVNATGDTSTTHEFYVYANLTGNLSINNETSKWNVTIVSGDTTPPNVTIKNPLYYGTYLNVTSSNYTVVDNEATDSCWYSTDNGATNSSVVTAGTNFTGIIIESGDYNITIYCNDTNNNIGNNTHPFNIGNYDTANEINKLTASDGAANEKFGGFVSLSGDYAIIGAYWGDVGGNTGQGSAYIFKKNSSGEYEEVNKLTASDGAAGDLFGYSVSISKNYAIIGAYNDSVSGNNEQGSAYIFKKNSSGEFEEVNKITASDGDASDLFGYSVSISDDYAIIGARSDNASGNPNQGSAYIFKKNSSGEFEEVNKLTGSDSDASDLFGNSVSINGDYAIVGAYNKDAFISNKGAAYIFKKNSSGEFEEVNKITASDGADSDSFGWSISLSGDHAIIGAYHDDVSGNDFQGSAYIFKKNSSGEFEEVNKLTASDGAQDDLFGYSVSISGDYAVIGMRGDDGGGSSYIFKKNSSGEFKELKKLIADNVTTNDNFGTSVSLSGDYAMISADRDEVAGNNYQGSAYTFQLDQETKLSIERIYPLTDLTVNQYEIFNVTVNATCRGNDCNEVNVSLSSGSLISSVPGTTPFYVNNSNPVSISLNKDESEEVTFELNATGSTGNTYEFFSYANKTSDLSINNETSKWDVTIADVLYPSIEFINPTPADNTLTNNNTLEINVSIEEENLENLTYEWDGTNYTIYDNTLNIMYNFDNRSELGENDSLVVDISNNENATCTNCPVLSDGVYDKSYNFDGIDDVFTFNGILGGNLNWTVSVWFKTTNNLGTDEFELVGEGGSASGHTLGCGLTHCNYYVQGSDLKNASFGIGNITEGKWYHMVGTHSAGRMAIYLDGVLMETDSGIDTINDPANDGFIGYDDGALVHTYSDLQDYFNGSIDEVRIWNRTLTDEEVYIDYISNLNKINSTQWYLNVNQSKNSTDELENGNYTYVAYAEDQAGNINSTSRNINISDSRVIIGRIYPLTDVNVSENEFFNVTVNVTCRDLDCGEVNVSLDPLNTEEWIMFGGYLNHTSYTTNTAPENISIKSNNYTTGSVVYSSPAVANGYVYVGSLDDNVYQLNATDMSYVNNYTTGNDVYSSPAVANGYVYVGSYDDNVYQLNATDMSLVNSYTTGNDVYSSPAVANGYVYVGSLDNNVYQLNATDMSLVNSYATGNDVFSSPAVANGYVYVGSFDDNVYQLNATDMSLVNNYATRSLVYSSPAVANGYVYVGSVDNNVYQLGEFVETKGLISTTPGTTPFYTNTSNPFNTSLNKDESQLVTWYVNATGSIGNTYEFFAYANKTSDFSTNDETTHWNVTIADITSPTIQWVNPTPANNTVTNVTEQTLNFTCTDTNLNETWIVVNETTYSSLTNVGDSYYLITNFTEGVNNFTGYCNDTSGNEAQTETRIITIDTTPPTWSDNETSINNHIDTSSFNISWTDNIALDTILFESNYTGTDTNYTMNNIAGDVYNYSALMAAGTYYWKSYANDTAGNRNFSDTFYFTIEQTVASCSLTITDNVTYNNTITPSCECTGIDATLYQNSTDITAFNNTELQLAAGDYNFTCNASESENFTSATNSALSIVSKANSEINLYFNGTEGNLTQLFGNLNVTAEGENGTVIIYRNGTDKTSENATLVKLQPGYYNYTANINASENYTSSSVTYFLKVLDLYPSPSQVVPENNRINDTEENVNVTFVCNATDDIELKNLSIYVSDKTNTSFILRNYSDVTGTFNKTNVSLLLEPGNYSWACEACDNASQCNTTANYTYYQSYSDTTPPVLTVYSPTAKTYSVSEIYLNVSSNENVTICVYSIDGNANSSLDEFNTTRYHGNETLADGNHNITFYCNDTWYNTGTASVEFGIDTSYPIVDLHYPLGVYVTQTNVSFNYTPTTQDNLIDTCKLYHNASGWKVNETQSAVDNVTNVFVVNLTDGDYIWNVECNDSAGNSDFSAQGNQTFTVDTLFPQWSNNETSITSHTEASLFNISWTDNLALDTILFESNYSGASVNYTMNNIVGDVYNYSALIAAGTYYWKSYANDSAGNLNESDTFNFSIAKTTTICSLTITDNVTYNNTITPSCECTGIDATLYQNSTNITAFNNTALQLAAGDYNFTCNASSSENYTSATDSSLSVVSKANSEVNLYFNGTSENLTQSYGPVNVTAEGENGTLIIRRNGIDVTSQNNTAITLLLGYYNYTAIINASENYTSSSKTLFLNITNYYPDVNSSIPLNYNDTKVLNNITFSCNATDDYELANLSIYITNSNNASFLLNSSTNVSGTFNETNFTLQLDLGTYTWGCEACDTEGLCNVSINKTFLMNYSDGPTINILTPSNGASYTSNTLVNVTANVTDIYDVSNVTINITGAGSYSSFMTNDSSLYYYAFNVTTKGTYTIRIDANNSYNLNSTSSISVTRSDDLGGGGGGGGSDPYCGDGSCNGDEDCSTCPSDCGVCSTCGDGTCDSDEDCSSCPSDCGVCSYCGDGTCDSDEDCSSCPSDCGECSYCGDGTCDPDESCDSCSDDCGECDTFSYEEFDENATNYTDVPCYDSISEVVVERVDSYDFKAEEGREIIVDPFSLQCRNDVQLSVAVPYNYKDFLVHVCRNDICEIITQTNVTKLLCEDGTIKEHTRQEKSYKPQVGDAPSVEKILVDENFIEFEGASFELDYQGKVTLDYLKETIPNPLNTQIKIISKPVVLEINGSTVSEITLSYPETEGIYPNSMAIFSYDEKWNYLGGNIDPVEKTVTVKSNITGKTTFAVMGTICVDCFNASLKKVYDSNSEYAMILIHGLGSTPAQFQALINDFKLTKQPVDIWTFGYPHTRHIEENSKEFSELMEANMQRYDDIFIVGHSLGGVVSQIALQNDYENKNYVSKVREVILLGVPNEGIDNLDSLKKLGTALTNIKTIYQFFNLDSASVQDLKEGIEIERVQGINYRVIAGTKPYTFDVGPVKISSTALFNFTEENDGVLTLSNVKSVGGIKVDELCENYWELHLSHTELNDDEKARQLIAAIIGNEIGLDKIDLAQKRFIEITVPDCKTGDKVYVTGIKDFDIGNKIDLCKGYIRESCNDGILNQNEEKVDCGGICEPCFSLKNFYDETKWLLLGILIGIIVILSLWIHHIRKHDYSLKELENMEEDLHETVENIKEDRLKRMKNETS